MDVCGWMAPSPVLSFPQPSLRDSLSHSGEIPPWCVPPTHFKRKERRNESKEEAEQQLGLLNSKNTKVASYKSGATSSTRVKELLSVRAVGCAQQGSASALSPHPTAPGLLPSQSIKRGKSSCSASPGQGRCTGDQDSCEMSEPLAWGAFLQLFGVGRPYVISHLREKLCSADVIDCTFFLTCHTLLLSHMVSDVVSLPKP